MLSDLSIKTVSAEGSNHLSVSDAACDRCGGALEAVEIATLRADTPRLRVGSPVAPRTLLLAWRCAQCGSFSPRFERTHRHRTGR